MQNFQKRLTKNFNAVLPLIEKGIYSENRAIECFNKKPDDFETIFKYLKTLKLETYIKQAPVEISGKVWFTEIALWADA